MPFFKLFHKRIRKLPLQTSSILERSRRRLNTSVNNLQRIADNYKRSRKLEEYNGSLSGLLHEAAQTGAHVDKALAFQAMSDVISHRSSLQSGNAERTCRFITNILGLVHVVLNFGSSVTVALSLED